MHVEKHSLSEILRPPLPSPLFTGRAEELDYMVEFFRQTHESVLTLRGMAGSGKTQLALKFAQVTTLHSDVLYVDDTTLEYAVPEFLNEPATPQAGAALDTTIEQTSPDPEIGQNAPGATANPSARVGLVILDNLIVPRFCESSYCYSFKRYMRRVFGFEEISIIYVLNVDGSALGKQERESYASWLTRAFSHTRASLKLYSPTNTATFPGMYLGPGATHLSLGSGLPSQPFSFSYSKLLEDAFLMPPSLAVEDAACLLIKSACLAQEDVSVEDNEAARRIAKSFGCFPPIIVQFGAVIHSLGLTLQASQQIHKNQNQEWIEKISTSLDPFFRSNYRKCTEPARMLLRLLVLLPFTEPLLRNVLIRARINFTSYQPLVLGGVGVELIKKENEALLSLFTSSSSRSTDCNRTLTDAITNLQLVFGLPFGGHGKGWRRCIYTWARTVVHNQPFTEESAAYLLATSIGSDIEYGADYRALMSQLEPFVAKMLLCYPSSRTYHYLRFSQVYEARGQWRQALRLQDRMVEKCKQQWGQYHTNTFFAANCLAKTYCKLGHWGEAKKLQSALLSQQKATFSELNLDILALMSDLGLTLSRMGRWQEAESIQEDVCDGRKQALGELHPDTLSAMHSLASNYFGQGRWQEAQELHENVLQTRRQVLGEQHADTLSSMHSLATKHWEAGQSTKDSEALNLEVLGIRKQTLGLEHPDTLSSMFALAAVYQRQGQWQQATQLAADVLKTQAEVLGLHHAETLSTMHSLASWYSEHGRLSEATSLRAEILQSRKAVYQDSHHEILASMEELVSAYWRQGLWAQAEILHLELLEARKRTTGGSDAACVKTSLDLAARYLNQCRWREASLIYKEVLTIKMHDRELESDDPELADVRQQLDLALFALSLDVFIISPTVPMESVVAHFTGRAGLKDYTARLQEALDPSTAPITWGGFSDIYQIKIKDGRDLAVKCLKGAHGEYKQVKQTVRELSTWSQLRHKGIAELLGLALFKGQLAMVSTWNKHGNVMSYIEQQPHMDRYALCMQVVSAVVYLHKSEVVHGDLKGANILVSADGALQLTDFGLTIMHDATIHFSKSANEVSGGTLRWMAPELVFGNDASQNSGQASGSMSETLTKVKENESGSNPQPKLCKETDIYALGMTMLEIFTGKRPFKELEKDTAVILALSKGKRPHRPKKILDQSPRGVPFWDILQKCWAQTPGDRPTASEVDTSMLLLGNE